MPTPNAWEQIATHTVSGGSPSTITFSSIPGTYGVLILSMKTIGATDGRELGIRFNGDSGSNYQYCRVIAEGSGTFSANAATGGTYARIGDNNLTYSNHLLYIPNYANSSVYKTVQCEGTANQSTSNNTNRAYTYTGVWKSNSAITSLSIVNETGAAHNNNSVFSLYGLKG
jgi:hypothetical protein